MQRPGSLLSKSELKVGHRDARDSTVKLWLEDIEQKRFVLEMIPDFDTSNHPQRRKKRQTGADKSNNTTQSTKSRKSRTLVLFSEDESESDSSAPQDRKSMLEAIRARRRSHQMIGSDELNSQVNNNQVSQDTQPTHTQATNLSSPARRPQLNNGTQPSQVNKNLKRKLKSLALGNQKSLAGERKKKKKNN